jgi:hypothetical protein
VKQEEIDLIIVGHSPTMLILYDQSPPASHVQADKQKEETNNIHTKKFLTLIKLINICTQSPPPTTTATGIFLYFYIAPTNQLSRVIIIIIINLDIFFVKVIIKKELRFLWLKYFVFVCVVFLENAVGQVFSA